MSSSPSWVWPTELAFANFQGVKRVPPVSVSRPASGTGRSVDAVLLLLLRLAHRPPLVARPLQEAARGSNRQPLELARESKDRLPP